MRGSIAVFIILEILINIAPWYESANPPEFVIPEDFPGSYYCVAICCLGEFYY